MKKRLRKVLRFKGRMKSKRRNVFYWIRKNLNLIFTVISVVISLFILFFMIITYDSPPNVHCEIDLIQRPDSLFQAQLYIWNSGGQTAENITMLAKFRDVFQWDTSAKKYKSPLYVYPHLSVISHVRPIKILDETAKVKTIEDHRISIPLLSSSEREENYIIICPYLHKLAYYESLPNSIYREKFVELKKFNGIKNYLTEIIDNVIVTYNGQPKKIGIKNIIKLSEVDTNKFVFPDYWAMHGYRDKAITPENIFPPVKKKIKVIEDAKAEDEESWLLFIK